MKPKGKIYIDGANIFYTQQKLGWSIDWKKVKEYLQEKWNILEINYYTGIKPKDDKMAGFLRYLDQIGVKSITKLIKIIRIDNDHSLKKLYNYSEKHKSDCDVEIATDILLERKEIDEIILFSDDNDFKYLVKKLKDMGKKVIIFSSRKTIFWKIKLESSEYIFLEDIKDKIARK